MHVGERLLALPRHGSSDGVEDGTSSDGSLGGIEDGAKLVCEEIIIINC